MISARQLAERLLAEGVINGEYWIYEDGDIHYCDGDVGDENHEGHVIATAMGRVLGEMNLDADGDLDQDEFLRIIREAYEDDHGAANEEELDEFDIADLMAKEHHVNDGLLQIALGRGDPRRYACQHWKWHALRDNYAETWEITPEALTVIARGIDNALDETGVGEDEVAPDQEFYVHAYQGRRSMTLSYEQLQNREFEGEYKDTPRASPEQVRRLDTDMVPAYYQGNLGDSLQEARRGGWIGPVYHGTTAEFEEFDPGSFGVHFGTQQAALDRLGAAGTELTTEVAEDTSDGTWDVWHENEHQGNFPTEEAARAAAAKLPKERAPIEAYISLKSPLELPDLGQWHFDMIARELRERDLLDDQEYEAAWHGNREADLMAMLQRKGYDGVIYTNEVEDPGEQSYIVFSPRQIRRSDTPVSPPSD